MRWAPGESLGRWSAAVIADFRQGQVARAQMRPALLPAPLLTESMEGNRLGSDSASAHRVLAWPSQVPSPAQQMAQAMLDNPTAYADHFDWRNWHEEIGRRHCRMIEDNRRQVAEFARWPAPGSEDTELGVLMEPEVGHGETEVYSRVQA